jgi:galactokinase/mevalonate kinase-like predicted kinase
MRSVKQLSQDAGIALQKFAEDKAGITALKEQNHVLHLMLGLQSEAIDIAISQNNRMLDAYNQTLAAYHELKAKVNKAQQALSD